MKATCALVASMAMLHIGNGRELPWKENQTTEVIDVGRILRMKSLEGISASDFLDLRPPASKDVHRVYFVQLDKSGKVVANRNRIVIFDNGRFRTSLPEREPFLQLDESFRVVYFYRRPFREKGAQ